MLRQGPLSLEVPLPPKKVGTALVLRVRIGQRAEVSNDGARIRLSHVVDVHRGLDGQPVWPDALFEDLRALLDGKPRKAGQGGTRIDQLVIGCTGTIQMAAP